MDAWLGPYANVVAWALSQRDSLIAKLETRVVSATLFDFPPAWFEKVEDSKTRFARHASNYPSKEP